MYHSTKLFYKCGPIRSHKPRRINSQRASKPNNEGSISRPCRMTSPRSISICSALLAVSLSNGICCASCSIACLLYHCSCVSDIVIEPNLHFKMYCVSLHLFYGNMRIFSDSRFFLLWQKASQKMHFNRLWLASLPSSRHVLQYVQLT